MDTYLSVGLTLASLYVVSVLVGVLTGELGGLDVLLAAGVGVAIVLAWPAFIVGVIGVAAWDALRDSTWA